MRKATPLILAACTVAVMAAPASAEPRYRIIGGSVTNVEAVPYAAALVQRGRAAHESQFCGGSIVAPAAVLTAAHCVEDERADRIDVVTGRTRLNDSGSGQRTSVARVEVHPGWSSRSSTTDAAVLVLSRPVSARPVAAATQGEADLTANGRPAVVAGWGLTSERGSTSDLLRAVGVTVRSNATCSRGYGPDFLASVMLCAGGPAGDSCQGDSGGPLVTLGAGGAPRQIGIVSFGGERCADPGTPGAYTRVSAIAGWIARMANPGARPVPAAPVTRFGAITCGYVSCRVELRVGHDSTVGSVLVRIRRGSLNRVVRARRVSRGRWVATAVLPYGVVRLSATPLTPAGRRAGRLASLTVEVT